MQWYANLTYDFKIGGDRLEMRIIQIFRTVVQQQPQHILQKSYILVSAG